MKKLRNFVLPFLLGLSASANATLYDRGQGLIYDNVLNITWLQDANYAMTSGYHPDGKMSWQQAVDWATQLNYAGYNDWRLPKQSPVNGSIYDFSTSYNGSTDRGYGIKTPASEMSYMYYVNLGNQPRCSEASTTSNCIAPSAPLEWVVVKNASFESGGVGGNISTFQNVQNSDYWSGVRFPHDPLVPNIPEPTAGVFFYYGYGYQDDKLLTKPAYAWAVRDGDVTPPVPEAETYVLLLAGLGLVAYATRRRRSPEK